MKRLRYDRALLLQYLRRGATAADCCACWDDHYLYYGRQLALEDLIDEIEDGTLDEWMDKERTKNDS